MQQVPQIINDAAALQTVATTTFQMHFELDFEHKKGEIFLKSQNDAEWNTLYSNPRMYHIIQPRFIHNMDFTQFVFSLMLFLGGIVENLGNQKYTTGAG